MNLDRVKEGNIDLHGAGCCGEGDLSRCYHSIRDVRRIDGQVRDARVGRAKHQVLVARCSKDAIGGAINTH